MTPTANLAGGRRTARWTCETIIKKILEWEDRYGEPPGSADWNPSLARWRAQEWRAERYYDGVWPSTNAVKRAFGGSFDAAVKTAGFEPARPGPRRAAGAARPAVARRPPRRRSRGRPSGRASTCVRSSSERGRPSGVPTGPRSACAMHGAGRGWPTTVRAVYAPGA